MFNNGSFFEPSGAVSGISEGADKRGVRLGPLDFSEDYGYNQIVRFTENRIP